MPADEIYFNIFYIFFQLIIQYNMIKSMKNSAEALIFALFVATAGILASSGKYSTFVLDGIKLWAAVVLPSLFPYFFITAVLSSLSVTGKLSALFAPATKKLFNTGGIVAYVFLISILSGYPIGAKMISDLKTRGLLSESESVRAAAFCSTSSPMFLIGSVGTIMFENIRFGVCLLSCHIISALLVGIAFSFYKRKDTPDEKIFSPQKTDNVLYDSVWSAITSVLFVGGLITIFYLFTEILSSVGILKPFIYVAELVLRDENAAEGLVFGIFECTKGLKMLSRGGINFLTLPLAAAMCGMGGLSVICQSFSYLKKAKIKTAPFLVAKMCAAVLNFIIALLFSTLFL